MKGVMMAVFKVITTFSISILMIMSTAHAENFQFDFDGTWSGKLQKIEPVQEISTLATSPQIPEFIDYAIEISGDKIQVYLNFNGVWSEVKPQSFGSVTHKTNAVIAAMDSAFSQDGQVGWVETWNFTLTAKDNDSLYAYWVRAVNNPYLDDESHPDARFMMSRIGVLQRSEPVMAVNALQVKANAPDTECRQADIVCGNIAKLSTTSTEFNQKTDQRN